MSLIRPTPAFATIYNRDLGTDLTLGVRDGTHDIQPSELFCSALYHSYDLSFDGHICRNQMRPSTHLLDIIGDSTQLITFGRDVVQSDIEPIPGKTKCDTTPNALGGSGDEGDPFDDRHELERMGGK
jgi:hypothetical protein